MKTSLTGVLRCPSCGNHLQLHVYKSIAHEEVLDGALTCGCGRGFAVLAGVPRLMPAFGIPRAFLDSYRDRLQADAPAILSAPPNSAEFSFSLQWNEYEYDDLTWELRLPERVNLFYRYTGLNADTARGVSMLDAGCGNGTLSAELALQGLDVVALDYSDGAARGYQYQLFESRISDDAASRLNYVQGDLQYPPLPNDHFDLIYADGVLHHTPDTKRTFLALAPKVRPGGRLFIWLYRSDRRGVHKLKIAAVKIVRAATRKMSYRSRLSLCYVGAACILSLLRILRLMGYRGRPVIPLRQKAVNLFDTISPTHNHEHTPEETRVWFSEAGFADVREVTDYDNRLSHGGFAMIGTRRTVP